MIFYGVAKPLLVLYIVLTNLLTSALKLPHNVHRSTYLYGGPRSRGLLLSRASLLTFRLPELSNFSEIPSLKNGLQIWSIGTLRIQDAGLGGGGGWIVLLVINLGGGLI